MDNKTSDIGSRIKKIREDNDLKQITLAESLGISQNHLSNLELGKKTLSKAMLKTICYDHSVNPNWLLNGSEKPYLNGDPLTSLIIKYDLTKEDTDFIYTYCQSNERKRRAMQNIINNANEL